LLYPGDDDKVAWSQGDALWTLIQPLLHSLEGIVRLLGLNSYIIGSIRVLNFRSNVESRMAFTWW
jgi:hypothetical protein